MFREKEICDAIRTAYLHLFPDKKERKRALSRLDLELVAQGVRYRGEIVLAYQTSGSHERALDYYGPELFPQRGCCIYQKTVQSHSTQVDAACIRELWGCRLYPGTVASGGWTVCGGVRRNHKIPFGIRAVFYLLPHTPPYRQRPGLAGLSARRNCRCL